MPHAIILGMTESGKTTLAKKLAAGYRARGIGVLVCDPLNDPGWEADYRTTDSAQFMDTVRRSRSCAVFIDESGEVVGKYNDQMFWLATRGRHYGHNCHFITQRGSQLAKTVRDQAGRLYLFNCSLDDAKILANEWNKPELKSANTLRQGEFFAVSRFGPVEKHSVF